MQRHSTCSTVALAAQEQPSTARRIWPTAAQHSKHSIPRHSAAHQAAQRGAAGRGCASQQAGQTTAQHSTARRTRQGMRPVTGMPSAAISVILRGLLVISRMLLMPISSRMCATDGVGKNIKALVSTTCQQA